MTISEDNHDYEETLRYPTRGEIDETVNKGRNGKSPRKDRINVELFKYGRQELRKRLY